MQNLVTELHSRLEKIYQGGGAKAAAKQKEKGKMLARERVDYLFDKDKPRVEIGALAGFEMYEEHGGCPGAGVVVEISSPPLPEAATTVTPASNSA